VAGRKYVSQIARQNFYRCVNYAAINFLRSRTLVDASTDASPAFREIQRNARLAAFRNEKLCTINVPLWVFCSFCHKENYEEVRRTHLDTLTWSNSSFYTWHEALEYAGRVCWTLSNSLITNISERTYIVPKYVTNTRVSIIVLRFHVTNTALRAIVRATHNGYK
jgi:hypothetical protein